MKKAISILLAVLLFIGLYIMTRNQFDFEGKELIEWQMSYDDKTEVVTFPFARNVKEPTIYTFETTTSLENSNVLIIPQMYGYGIRVFIDDINIYQIGSFKDPSANVWMKIHSIRHDLGDDSELHDIRIESYAMHDIGVNGPVYISDYDTVLPKLRFAEVFNVDIPFILFGCYLTSGLFMFSIVFRTRKQGSSEYRKLFIQFGIISLAFANFTVDGLFWHSAGSFNNLFLMRRFIIGSLVVGTYFMVVALRKTIQDKETNKLMTIPLALVIIGVIFSPSMHGLHMVLQYFSAVLLIAFVYVLLISFKAKNNNSLFADTFLGLTATHALLLNLNVIEGFYLYFVGLFLFVIDMNFIIAYRYEYLNKLSNDLSVEVVRDSLTSAYNRSYLSEVEVEAKDNIVFMDMNKFKVFNDKYGHHEGDKLLIKLVDIISQYLYSEDALIRYGGDEFVIVFRNRELADCERVLALVLLDLRKDYDEVDFAYGIVEHGEDLAEAVKAADAKMYHMKNANKSGV